MSGARPLNRRTGGGILYTVPQIAPHPTPSTAMLRTFWTASLRWSTAGAALAALHAYWVHATGDAPQGWFGVWMSLRVFPETFALLLPLAAFAGGLAATTTRDLARIATSDPWRSRAALCTLAAVVAAVALAYLEPWLSRLCIEFAMPTSARRPLALETPEHWYRVHRWLTARAVVDPSNRGLAHLAGLSLYLPLVGGGVAGCATALGLLVGERTRGGDLTAHAHEWAAGGMLVGTVHAGWVAARSLAGRHDVPPEAAAILPVVGPALLALALLWSARLAPRPTDARVG